MTRDDLIELQTCHSWLGVPIVLLGMVRIQHIMDNANKIYNWTANKSDRCRVAKERRAVAGGVIVYFGERYFAHLTPGRETFQHREFT